MGLFDFYKKSQFAAAPRSGAEVIAAPDFGGSRTTIPKFMQGGGGVGGALPKKAQRDLALDDRTLAGATVDDLMDILMDAHPDLSYAVWNFIRLGNTEYDISVRKPGSDKPDKASDKVIQQFLDSLDTPDLTKFTTGRSMKKVLGQLIQSVVTRGASALEMVMLPDLSMVSFLAPVDPGTIDFKFEQDRFVPYQNQEKLSLDIPTFFYEGLDERIDDPYGRNPLLGAVNMVMFQIQVLNDIKAVVHNQGYPRFDIKIVEEVLINRMPISIRNNEGEKQKWLNSKLQEIIDSYNNLAVDDTFVHFDSIEIGMAGGGQGGGTLLDPQKLMAAIDNLVMTGLKTLSTILGRRPSGTTESFAKIEIKLYIQGVKAIQEVVERIMSRAMTMMLNLAGKQGIVTFKFKAIEIRTELEQAQFEQIALINYAFLRDQGWVDQDQASIMATGKPAVGQPNMDMLGKGGPATGGATSGTGGSTGSSGGGSSPSGSTSTSSGSGGPSGSTDNNPNAGGATAGN